MQDKGENKKRCGVKKFFSGMIERFDKKMKEKAKSQPCCCKPSGNDKNSCCS